MDKEYQLRNTNLLSKHHNELRLWLIVVHFQSLTLNRSRETQSIDFITVIVFLNLVSLNIKFSTEQKGLFCVTVCKKILHKRICTL